MAHIYVYMYIYIYKLYIFLSIQNEVSKIKLFNGPEDKTIFIEKAFRHNKNTRDFKCNRLYLNMPFREIQSLGIEITRNNTTER